MFCTRCGKELKEGVRFCTNCGAPVKARPAHPEPKEQQPETRQPEIRQPEIRQPEARQPEIRQPEARQPETREPKERQPDGFAGGAAGQNGQESAPAGKPKKQGGVIAVIIILAIAIIGLSAAAFWLLGGQEMVYDLLGIESHDTSIQEDEETQDTEDLSEEYLAETSEGAAGEITEQEDMQGMGMGSTESAEAPMPQEADGENTPSGMAEEEIQEEPQEESEYLLENSDTEYLTKEDLEGFTAEQCRLARNELYARHGRLFDDEELQNYFNSCSWYQGSVPAEDFDESMLSEIEMANRDLIVEYEEEMGYR